MALLLELERGSGTAASAGDLAALLRAAAQPPQEGRWRRSAAGCATAAARIGIPQTTAVAVQSALGCGSPGSSGCVIVMICATDGRTLPLRPLLLELAVLSSDCGRLTTTLLGAVLGGVRCRLLWLTGGGVAAAAVRGGVVTTPAWCSRTDAASAAVAHGAPAPAELLS